MKEHHFVQLLGEEAGAAGKQVAELIEEVGSTEAISDIPEEWGTSQAIASRMRRELPRRISVRLHGRRKGRVEFRSHTVSAETDSGGGADEGVDFAIVFEVNLPDYTLSTGALMTTVALASRERAAVEAPSGLADRAEQMLLGTPDSFVLTFPVDGEAKVVPCQAIVAAADAGAAIPRVFPDGFYYKSLDRFVQELARGYIGDGSVTSSERPNASWEAKERAYREMLSSYNLASVLHIGVEQGDRDARLNEF